MAYVVDQNLMRTDANKDEFSYMYSRLSYGAGNFVSREQACKIIPWLQELDFRITVTDGFARLWFRPADYAAYEQKKNAAKETDASSGVTNLTPVFLIGGTLLSLVMGVLAMWYRFSGQIASGMGTKTPMDSFITYSITTAVIVFVAWLVYLFNRARNK